MVGPDPFFDLFDGGLEGPPERPEVRVYVCVVRVVDEEAERILTSHARGF